MIWKLISNPICGCGPEIVMRLCHASFASTAIMNLNMDRIFTRLILCFAFWFASFDCLICEIFPDSESLFSPSIYPVFLSPLSYGLGRPTFRSFVHLWFLTSLLLVDTIDNDFSLVEMRWEPSHCQRDAPIANEGRWDPSSDPAQKPWKDDSNMIAQLCTYYKAYMHSS